MTLHDHPWVVLFLQYVCIFHSGLCWLYYSFVAFQVLWWPNKLELWSVLPHIRPSIHKKYFRFRSSLVLVGLDRICAPVWLQLNPRSRSRSLSFWSSKNCTFLGLSPPPFWCGAQNWWLIVIVWDLARFFNFLSESYHMTSYFAECQHYRLSKGHISVLVEARVTW